MRTITSASSARLSIRVPFSTNFLTTCVIEDETVPITRSAQSRQLGAAGYGWSWEDQNGQFWADSGQKVQQVAA